MNKVGIYEEDDVHKVIVAPGGKLGTSMGDASVAFALPPANP